MGLETGEVNEDLNSDTVKVVEVDVGESSVEDSIEHLFVSSLVFNVKCGAVSLLTV